MTALFLFFLMFQQEVPARVEQDVLDSIETDIATEDVSGLQAVISTSAGEFVMEFYPDQAPNHVAHFMKLAREDYYVGTAFHSMVSHGIVQAGDPLTKEADREAEYGTGGFNLGLEPEISDLEFVEGTVVATLLPGDAASAGSQFFVCVGDQPQFTGQFTAFGHVVEGLEVIDVISTTPIDEKQIAMERVEILGITIRPIPPPPVPPFSEESVEELAEHRVIMETSKGDIVLEFFPDVAPNHVRHFLRLTSLGVYDKTAFHRVAPGFVIQAGDLNTRTETYPQAARDQRDETHRGDRVDGARRRDRQRLDVLLYRPGGSASARRLLHCVWTSCRRDGCRHSGRGRRGRWRNTSRTGGHLHDAS